MKLLTEKDVTITLTADYESEQIRGNAIDSGDKKYDTEVEDKLIAEVESGNVWAWCTIEVKAVYKGLEASDYLGCCSYETAEDFKSRGYYTDMIATVLADLNAQLSILIGEIVEPIKTLLITGTYSTHQNGNVLYNVNIWGQTTETPKITLITFTQQAMTGYNELIELSRARFCQYFGVDDYNITYIEHLIPLNIANQ